MAMEMKAEEVAQFCAYFSLARAQAALPLAARSPAARSPPSPPSQKPRPKFQPVDTKKQERPVRSKMQFVPAVSKNVSQRRPQQGRYPQKAQIVEDRTGGKGYGLDYFVSQLSNKRNDQGEPKSPIRQIWQTETMVKTREPPSPLQNYDTFGRKAALQSQKDRGNLTERKPNDNQWLPTKPTSNFESSSWMFSTQTQCLARSQIGLQQNSPLSRSPFRQQFTPTRSQVRTKYSPDSALSKSRTRPGKKAERPLYNPSQLTVRKDSEAVIRDNRLEVSNISQSFISLEDTQNQTLPRKTEDKRETSTTAPPHFRGRHQLEGSEVELDDHLGTTLSELSRRNPPVGVQVRLRAHH